MSRLRANALVWALLVVGSLAQRPGQTTFDVKLDLTENPLGFLGSALNLWSAGVDFGSLQNQAYGYLFPMGSWYAMADLAGVPDWTAQRLWSALLLVAAYEGTRRLAAAIGLAGTTRPILAGLAYALSPRILGLSGVLTGEILPSCVLPWVCLPLVLALQGRLDARRAGLLSGGAVLLMGGINASENLLALPLPLLLVLSGVRRDGGRRLAGWWALATTLACLWWMLPLMLLGKYSPPFLDYIETARGTTLAAGWSNVVRGAEHWLGYIFVAGRPWWQAAFDLSAAPVLVLLAGAVAAVGFGGLFHPRMPFRTPLALAALLGMALMTAGHGGWEGTPLSGMVREVLDGALAAFRNIHKADPLVRLPLALGFGYAVGLAAHRLSESQRPPVAAGVRVATLLAALGLLLGTAAPMLSGDLRHPGWRAMPASWVDAGRWLDRADPGVTLVLPSTSMGVQDWGRTVDLPIQVVTDSAWVARTQIPLVPPATIRLMDGLVQRLETGGGSPSLTSSLRTAGITRVLVAHDADPTAADTADLVDPGHIAAVLAGTPGIQRAAAFGGDEDPLVEIYTVGGGAALPATVPASGVPTLVGAPEDVLAARDAGLLAPGQVADLGPVADRAPDIVADGQRRLDRQLGRVHDAVGPVLAADEPHRTSRLEHDYAGVAGVPAVQAEWGPDVRAVTASTSSGYADAVGQIDPALGPAAAVDGDPDSYWRSAPFTDATQQWLQLRLDGARPIGRVTVTAGVTGFSGTPISRIAVDAGGEVRSTAVDPVTGRAVVDFGGAREAETIRVRIAKVAGDTDEVSVALHEVSVEGVTIARTLRVPDVGADAGTDFLFSTEAPRRACAPTTSGTECDPYVARPGAERGVIDRRFSVSDSGSWRLRGLAVASSEQATWRLLEPLGGDVVRARSSSVLGNEPAAAPMFAVDGDPLTSWLGAHNDMAPTLELSWGKPRRIDRLSVRASAPAAITPFEAVIQSGDQLRTVRLGTDGLGYFAPIVTDSVTITFHAAEPAVASGAHVGIGEVTVHGAAGRKQAIPLDTPFRSACGLGPQVSVDGVALRTRVRGTLRDVVSGRPLRWRSCDGRAALHPGDNHLLVRPGAAFLPTAAVLDAGPSGVAAAAVRDRVTSSSPISGRMSVRVTDGPRAVLFFGQNANIGWHATLGGHRLVPTLVDGWQQGFVVPAGAGGTVEISFGPDRSYAAALAVGAAAVIALLLLLALALLRPGPVVATGDHAVRERQGSGRGPWLVLAGTGLAWLALAGPLAAGTALLAALAVVGGLATWVRGAGAVAIALSAVAAVYSPTTTPGTVANVLAAVGAGLLAGSLIQRRNP